MGLEQTGFLFPNDVHVHWSLMIVMYPYITGLVAGAFVVSSLYHVFGVKDLKPVGRFALAASFCFLCVATLPLLNHLGQPQRALNVMFTPNFSSAMAGFGIIYSIYFVIVLLEIWFIYRVEIIMNAMASSGIKRLIWSFCALGVYDTSRRKQSPFDADEKVITDSSPRSESPRPACCTATWGSSSVRIEGQSVVVHVTDARRLSVLGDGVGDRAPDRDLSGRRMKLKGLRRSTPRSPFRAMARWLWAVPDHDPDARGPGDHDAVVREARRSGR